MAPAMVFLLTSSITRAFRLPSATGTAAQHPPAGAKLLLSDRGSLAQGLPCWTVTARLSSSPAVSIPLPLPPAAQPFPLYLLVLAGANPPAVVTSSTGGGRRGKSRCRRL